MFYLLILLVCLPQRSDGCLSTIIFWPNNPVTGILSHNSLNYVDSFNKNMLLEPKSKHESPRMSIYCTNKLSFRIVVLCHNYNRAVHIVSETIPFTILHADWLTCSVVTMLPEEVEMVHRTPSLSRVRNSICIFITRELTLLKNWSLRRYCIKLFCSKSLIVATVKENFH